MAKNGTNDSQAPKGSEKMSKDAKKKLFAAADAADLQVAKAKDALEKAIEARTTAIGALKSQLGSGPFQYQGRIVTIRSRVEKDENGEPLNGGRKNHYFVGQRDLEVEVID